MGYLLRKRYANAIALPILQIIMTTYLPFKQNTQTLKSLKQLGISLFTKPLAKGIKFCLHLRLSASICLHLRSKKI